LAQQILKDFQLTEGLSGGLSGGLSRGLSGKEALISQIPPEKRKILLMDSYAKSFHAMLNLTSPSGALGTLKNAIQLPYSDLKLSGRIYWDEGEFLRHAGVIQGIFDYHKSEELAFQSGSKRDFTTRAFSKDTFSMPIDKLTTVCKQMYRECYIFYRAFSDFVTLLQVHKNLDMGQLGESVPASRRSRSPGAKGGAFPLRVSSSSATAPSSLRPQDDAALPSPSAKALMTSSSGASPRAAVMAEDGVRRSRSRSSLQFRSSGGGLPHLSIDRCPSGEIAERKMYKTLLEERLPGFILIKDVFENIASFCPQHIKDAYDTQYSEHTSCNYFGSI
jgi:hypothetical protein